MRFGPAYSAERFPGDFVASAIAGAVTAAVLGPLIWWLARRYLLQTYPNHPEVLGAAVVTGVMDGLLLAALTFTACFAFRIWRYERLERKQSDAALRRDLHAIALERERGTGEDPPIPQR